MTTHVGISNIGNTCCYNTLLQCMHSVSYFRNYFQNLGLGSGSGLTVGSVLKSMVDCMSQFGDEAAHQLIRSLNKTSPDLTPYVQHDIDEIFHILVDILDRESSHPEKQIPRDKESFHQKCKRMWKTFVTSMPVALMSGMKILQVRCSKCGLCSHNFEPYTVIPLDLPAGETNMTSLIEQSLMEKEIDGDRSCDRCKHNSATTVFRVYEPAPMLVITLKRFVIDGRGRARKHRAHVNLDALEIDTNDHNMCISHKPKRYILRSVACHSGGLDGGHYYSYVQDQKEGTWSLIDDDVVVNGISVEDMVSGCKETAYMLFYEAIVVV